MLENTKSYLSVFTCQRTANLERAQGGIEPPTEIIEAVKLPRLALPLSYWPRKYQKEKRPHFWDRLRRYQECFLVDHPLAPATPAVPRVFPSIPRYDVPQLDQPLVVVFKRSDVSVKRSMIFTLSTTLCLFLQSSTFFRGIFLRHDWLVGEFSGPRASF